jgi:hypothetical protein
LECDEVRRVAWLYFFPKSLHACISFSDTLKFN